MDVQITMSSITSLWSTVTDTFILIFDYLINSILGLIKLKREYLKISKWLPFPLKILAIKIGIIHRSIEIPLVELILKIHSWNKIYLKDLHLSKIVCPISLMKNTQIGLICIYKMASKFTFRGKRPWNIHLCHIKQGQTCYLWQDTDPRSNILFEKSDQSRWRQWYLHNSKWLDLRPLMWYWPIFFKNAIVEFF